MNIFTLTLNSPKVKRYKVKRYIKPYHASNMSIMQRLARITRRSTVPIFYTNPCKWCACFLSTQREEGSNGQLYSEKERDRRIDDAPRPHPNVSALSAYQILCKDEPESFQSSEGWLFKSSWVEKKMAWAFLFFFIQRTSSPLALSHIYS